MVVWVVMEVMMWRWRCSLGGDVVEMVIEG